jgi:8-oxo-dGTP pyrophosphatase MutT (NUDIX family)
VSSPSDASDGRGKLLRESARALILDPEDHVLLVHFDWDGLDVEGGFWASPGGGVEPGESRLAALQRELREETGLTVDTLGPEVWTKTALFSMAGWDGQVDHTYLYRTERFDPAPAMSADQLRAEHVHDIRWWSPAELAQPRVTFSPRVLPQLLERLRREGVPATPIVLHGF